MKRILIIAFAIMSSAIAINAQLKVNSEGKVGIARSNVYSGDPNLTIGYNSYFGFNNCNIGLGSTTETSENFSNVAIEGIVEKNSNYTYDSNYGVLGIVDNITGYHARNFGVAGMINPGINAISIGGAGIYGSTSVYPLFVQQNILGAYAGYFYGPVKMTGDLTVPNVYTTSDSRLKENIVPLNETDNSGVQTLKNILNMNVVEYNYKDTEAEDLEKASNADIPEDVKNSIDIAKKNNAEMASKRHIGLIAQELKEIYPDMVQEGQDGYLAVNYSELVPVLIRSIQVLKQEVDELKGIDGSVRMAPQSAGMNSNNANFKNKLFQNTPNPFKEKTVIRFLLADDVRDAAICIFDMSGKMLKKLPVSSGMESVSVNGYELGEGMFLYSLTVNGQEIDTKRMILSR